MNGLIEWFNSEYDHSSLCTPIMIHLGDTSDYAASPNSKCRVMTKDKLDIFKKNIYDFCIAIKGKMNQSETIGNYLQTYKLRSEDIVSQYTVKMK